MKRSLLFILSLITCFSVKASRADTVFYDDLWRFAHTKERCTFYRIIEKQDDSLCKITDYYKNDSIARIGTYIDGGSYLRSAIASNVFATGQHKYYYYKSGFIRSEGDYHRGKKHGHWKSFHDTTGYLLATGDYILGQPHGDWLYYFNDPGVLQASATYNKGVKVGNWRSLFPNGLTYTITDYNSKGEKINDEIEYYPNGSVYSIEHFGSDGNAFKRTMETFYSNGQKRGIFKYKGNVIEHGKCYDEDGKKVECEINRAAPKYTLPYAEYDLRRYLYNNYSCPKVMEGKEFYDVIGVRFNIDSAGNVCDIESLSPEAHLFLQADALITISSLPAWVPSRFEGEGLKVTNSVRMIYSSDEEDVKKFYNNTSR